MSSDIAEFAVLPNGTKYPVIGLGTHNVTGGPGSVRKAVKYAIDIGYRSVDCAYAYENEKEVGDGIQAKLDDGTIKDKKEMFITTKLWNTHHNPRHIKENFQKSLDNLKVNCVQLLVIHWPISLKDGDDLFPKDKNDQIMFANHDIIDTWKGMEELVDAGMAENIGLSNFNKSQVERILQSARIKPCNLQVEIHPYFSNRKLANFCLSKGITVTAYAPLANPDSPLWLPINQLSKPRLKLKDCRSLTFISLYYNRRKGKEPSIFDEPVLKDIAQKKGKTIPQVVLRFILQRNIIVIPKSVTPSRIKENFDVFSFSLSPDEMEQIWALDKYPRIWIEKWASEHKEYPFHEDF
ncbi:aldo-keto reductase family 1 member B1-like [Mytilus californianus]|uniref:aldo-keto reductase family 1 member B1-like n=1 Tax=Mytilus californianus TaxID=6549 RepID=UPI0022478224|nr:aldo-keto reductase family 1 member B1-like [Mytilus californianus]